MWRVKHEERNQRVKCEEKWKEHREGKRERRCIRRRRIKKIRIRSKRRKSRRRRRIRNRMRWWWRRKVERRKEKTQHNIVRCLLKLRKLWVKTSDAKYSKLFGRLSQVLHTSWWMWRRNSSTAAKQELLSVEMLWTRMFWWWGGGAIRKVRLFNVLFFFYSFCVF